MGAKYLLMKGYYENGELSPLHYLLISFERFLCRRKDLPVKRQNAELNFIRVLKKMVKLKEQMMFKPASFLEEQKKKLLTLLDNKKPMVNTKWLREQVQAL